MSRAPCEPVAGEHYCKYVVQPGDNLAALATRFNLNGGQVPGWELLWASNRLDLTGVDDVLAVGQTLRVPTEPGVLHTVFPGESLMALAVAYGAALYGWPGGPAERFPSNVRAQLVETGRELVALRDRYERAGLSE